MSFGKKYKLCNQCSELYFDIEQGIFHLHDNNSLFVREQWKKLPEDHFINNEVKELEIEITLSMTEEN